MKTELSMRKSFDILNKLEIYAFIYIGGNDSMDTIKKLSDYAIITGQTQKFLGVPKTIDNDLALTDHTPGFGSAAKYIAASTKEVIRDAEGLTYKKKYDHHYGDHGKKRGLAHRRHCTFQVRRL